MGSAYGGTGDKVTTGDGDEESSKWLPWVPDVYWLCRDGCISYEGV